jgi:hypothetical protein
MEVLGVHAGVGRRDLVEDAPEEREALQHVGLVDAGHPVGSV